MMATYKDVLNSYLVWQDAIAACKRNDGSMSSSSLAAIERLYRLDCYAYYAPDAAFEDLKPEDEMVN
jgi:hypothetical protein